MLQVIVSISLHNCFIHEIHFFKLKDIDKYILAYKL